MERNRFRIFSDKRINHPVCACFGYVYCPDQHPDAPIHLMERVVPKVESQTMVRIMPDCTSLIVGYIHCQSFIQLPPNTIFLHSGK